MASSQRGSIFQSISHGVRTDADEPMSDERMGTKSFPIPAPSARRLLMLLLLLIENNEYYIIKCLRSDEQSKPSARILVGLEWLK